ncbi:hypothetical protein BGW42_004862 [Actinomortierella wolfii]|nr:hypothetical protein BGW42_004862 [Actinomortierella wolfii]KAG0225478.1 hypothetical protein BGW41_004681 [Actinomortierella wolfii]
MPQSYRSSIRSSRSTESLHASSQFSGVTLDRSKLHVLIVGAGVAGLFTAFLLELAGIEYTVLEKLTEISPRKSTVQLQPSSLHLFEQLGLHHEVMALGKPVATIYFRKHNMSVTGKVDASVAKERQGYYSYCIKRSKFLNYLRSKIPEEKVHFGRFVLEIVNGSGGVQCKCANGTVYDADILVGADGGYSAVRQKLYQRLKEKGLLPKTDGESLSYRSSALIGITEPMDINAFPVVDARFIEVNVVLSKDNSYTGWYSSAPERRLVWCVSGNIVDQGKDDNFKSSELGAESIQAACMAVSHLETPYGCQLRDLIAKTPIESIIKFMIEEKHFKTWFVGRTVLIGEAAHKFEPLSGLGPDAAMLDAAALVNELCKIQYNDLHEITHAFERYHDRRVEHVKVCINYTSTTAQFINGHGLAADIKRKIAFKLPMLVNSSQDKLLEHIPLTFLNSAPHFLRQSSYPPSNLS